VAAAAPVLAFVAIGKRFGGRTVLEAVDLELRAGEIHALLGENGAGKTTLVRTALGLIHPDAGELCVDGRAVAIRDPATAARLGIGLVQQHFALAEGMTVAENVLLGDAPRWHSRRRLEALARERLARHGAVVDPARRVADLSVGEKQRIEIAKALQNGARVLILDEPTAVLAPAEVGLLLERLRALARSGRSILFISHKLDEVLAVADRITVLRQGRVVLAAERAAVDARRLAAALFGEAPPDDAARPSAPARPPGAAVLSARALAGAGFGPLDLAVGGGECFGLFGVDGHGQTELLETLVGLRRAASGTLARPAAGIAFVSGDRQESGLALDLPLAENLALRRELLPSATFRRATLAAVAAPLLEEFDVRSEGPWQPARRLSGGNQQKVVLARELSIAPRLVLAENPTRGLDQQATAFVHARLRAVARGGAAVVVASTDLDEVLAIADRIAVIHRGRLHPCDRSHAAAAAALAAAAAARAADATGATPADATGSRGRA